ncbi:leucine-rich repeat-containing protein 10 [Hypanus sabinus]|uniref:leucine-rich repeat-containing protein 10 n=1 Tax=Hypanus sabinus TaxID=79690 RepID=UPI0028C37937|nr:leucine-rich repeat-containing protein 10 [Hypanus sabinus]XP_059834446.1 leucine-rich repeat-containing protein 10 [Hypanus sabinus]
MGNAIMSVVSFFPSKSCQHYLLGNDIEELPPDKMMDLSGKYLRKFPLQVCAFTELIKLYLSNNNLSSLPPELHLLNCLQILALDFNRFKELPQVVCRLRQLSALYLGNNYLSDLPAELSSLAELKTLWIEGNCFEEVPRVVSQLKHLRILHAGCNQLRELPTDLWHLRELQNIWISSNLFSDFPKVLLEIESLEIIDMDRNSIKFFPSLVHMKNLKLVIYDRNPCKSGPRVGEDVRRVGRWADYRPEVTEELSPEMEREQMGESEDVETTGKSELNKDSDSVPE